MTVESRSGSHVISVQVVNCRGADACWQCGTAAVTCCEWLGLISGCDSNWSSWMVLSNARSDQVEEHVKRMRACSGTTLETPFRIQSPCLIHLIAQDTFHISVSSMLLVYNFTSEVTFGGKLLNCPCLSISVLISLFFLSAIGSVL